MNRETAVRAGVWLWLTAVWVALWGELSWANVITGGLLAVVITVVLPLPRVPVYGTVRPWPLVKLLVVSTFYALQSGGQMAWLAVRPAPAPVSGVLRVSLDFRSDMVLVLCTALLNIIPGTMVLQLDRERRTAYVHVMDISSERAVTSFYSTTRRLENLLIAGFEERRTRR